MNESKEMDKNVKWLMAKDERFKKCPKWNMEQ